MTINEATSGEMLLKRREQRIYAIKGSLFAIGLVTGGIVGFLVADSGFSADAKWPASLALGLVATYIAAIGVGSWLLRELCDEVERQLQYKATTAAGLFYIIAYPIWFVLWKGSFLPEPSHWQLFLGFYAVLAVSYLFYRYR